MSRHKFSGRKIFKLFEFIPLVIIYVLFILFSLAIKVATDEETIHDDDTTLDFEWEAASGDVDHYNVYIYVLNGDEYILERVENTENAESEYAVENCSGGTTYKVAVQAVDAEGNVGPMSPKSDPVLCTHLTHAPKLPPEEDRLLPNYPNPFNPETWIPYQLAADSYVTIQVYDIMGRLVREISLGKKQKGYYITKSKAAYWDGKNLYGESVSSGVYFYYIKTDSFTSMRRMILIK